MDTNLNDLILNRLHWRYATKKFDSTKKIPQRDWATLQEALRLAPSSYGLQPWKFLVVMSPTVRQQLTPVSYNQPQIVTCSHLVVVTHLKSLTRAYVQDYFKVVEQVRQLPVDSTKSYQDMVMSRVEHAAYPQEISQWCAKQAYIAMGTFMTAAALLQVDVCPMEGIDAPQYDEILGLNNSPYTTVAVLATGYRAADDATQQAKKVRFDEKQVIQVI